MQARRFGLFPFRSPLLRESLLFFVPPGTEMFHFPGLATKPYFIQTPSTGHCPRWVFPFGNLRIKAYLPLPEAYRSLSRPSSPAGAKASVMRPFELDQNYKMFWPNEYFSDSLKNPDEWAFICSIDGEEYFLPFRGAREKNSRTPRNLFMFPMKLSKIPGRNVRKRHVPENGGRDRSRTCDLVLIRDAL